MLNIANMDPADATYPAALDPTVTIDVTRIAADGAHDAATRTLAAETPIAIEFNGIGYAVLMATPADLEDLAHGFARAERLVDCAADVVDVDTHVTERGVVLRVTITDRLGERIVERVRHRVAESSCGMCGIENLDQALRPLPCVTTKTAADDHAVFRALAALRDAQPLNRATGAVHAAAACTASGEIVMAREDVGRHNAFDKLIGAMLRAEQGWDGGFALLSSRCSYELVEKAALADCPMLVTISAPTVLAVRRAAEAGVALRVLARADTMLAP